MNDASWYCGKTPQKWVKSKDSPEEPGKKTVRLWLIKQSRQIQRRNAKRSVT